MRLLTCTKFEMKMNQRVGKVERQQQTAHITTIQNWDE